MLVAQELEFPISDKNPYLIDQYKKNNYREEIINPNAKLCYIFFSGNAIYYPNDVQTFTDTILKRDRYEYENLAKSDVLRHMAGKFIFVRDIYKHWYVNGINERCHDVRSMMDFLEERTKGYDVITIGNSAGGIWLYYMDFINQ